MLKLRRDTVVPLHAQITQELRYRISTGNLLPGSRLPSVRQAASRWGVHYHTVRRAYEELELLGLVVRSGARGTRVVDELPAAGSEPGLAAFLEETISEASQRFGISSEELGSLLANRNAKVARRVIVVECNESQAGELADDLRRAYSVETATRLLSDGRPMPDGIIVSTLFHRSEVIERWPDRVGSMRFLRIGVSPAIVEQLNALGPLPPLVLLYESDAGQGEQMAADVQAIVNDSRCRIRYRPLESGLSIPAEALQDPVVLVTPRHWNRLPAYQRRQPNVVRVPYSFDRTDLAGLETTLGRSPSFEPFSPVPVVCPLASAS